MAGAGVNPNKNIQQWPKKPQNRMQTPTGPPSQTFLQQPMSPPQRQTPEAISRQWQAKPPLPPLQGPGANPYQWQAQQSFPPSPPQTQSPTRDPRMIQWLQQMQQHYRRQ